MRVTALSFEWFFLWLLTILLFTIEAKVWLNFTLAGKFRRKCQKTTSNEKKNLPPQNFQSRNLLPVPNKRIQFVLMAFHLLRWSLPGSSQPRPYCEFRVTQPVCFFNLMNFASLHITKSSSVLDNSWVICSERSLEQKLNWTWINENKIKLARNKVKTRNFFSSLNILSYKWKSLFLLWLIGGTCSTWILWLFQWGRICVCYLTVMT